MEVRVGVGQVLEVGETQCGGGRGGPGERE